MEWIALGLALLLVLYILVNKLNNRSIEPVSPPIIIAHRGSSGACPENTYSAFDQALEDGAEMIELDIQLSMDGELMVIHDRSLERTTNCEGLVDNYTKDELIKLDAGTWFSKVFCEERIPVLDEVLEKYNGKIGFLIEVKYPKEQPEIGQKLKTTLEDFSGRKKGKHLIIVQSFDKEFLLSFNKMMPNLPLGLLIKKLPNLKEIERLSGYISYLNPKYTIVTKRFIQTIHEHSMKCIVWTVRTKNVKKKIHQMNVDGIATDYPEWYK
ncbi:glycerophosphodiester phosphodiesterase [Peribacillus acanthi]|uniref:glycerophosphodiester phosphodiesterase n=1 Tax=Peribacillus acanthi TaxID=2171554 RepID=UPI000D3E8013|nr:glycerophosphodiester phosphodiesterase [Peribacillus acanthi]